jgi:hypothetical protein
MVVYVVSCFTLRGKTEEVSHRTVYLQCLLGLVLSWWFSTTPFLQASFKSSLLFGLS